MRQISIAISTAASGLAVWLFALSWQRSGSYHGALVGAALLALVLAVCDLALLAKPETLEAIVRRAPTWEQLLAFRQRVGYFSYARRATQRAARLAAHLRARAKRSGLLGGVGVGGLGGGRLAEPDWEEEEVRQAWVDATLEPVHQANPIELRLAEPGEDAGGAAAREQHRA